jgi:chromosome segregation ATPase
MSTDVEAFLYLLETAEGKNYSELLVAASLSYEQALKYELTREKVFKRLGLAQSSSKVWRIQSELKSRPPLKPKPENQEIAPYEYIERLSCSHETTFKYSRFIQEMFEGYEKLSQSLEMVLDSSIPTSCKTFKTNDLEQIYYKDFGKFKEMDLKEAKILENYSKEFSIVQKNLHSILLSVEEKCAIYEKNLKNLENHVDSIILKGKDERDECQSRLQELLETCHDYSEQIEKLKEMNEEKLANEKKMMQSHFRKNSLEIEKNNSQLLEVIGKLESQISEISGELEKKDQKIEKMTENFERMTEKLEKMTEKIRETEGKNMDLKKELALNEKLVREKAKEENFRLESQTELKRLLDSKENELEEAFEKIKFLQEELSSYKYNRDQENKLKSLETREAQELRIRNKELKEDLTRSKIEFKELKDELTRSKNDLKDLQDLRQKCAEMKEEVNFYKTRLIDPKDFQDLKIKNSELKDELNFYKSKTQDTKEIQELKTRSKEMKDELAFFKSRSIDQKETQDLRVQNSKLKEELALSKSKISDIKEELLLYKNQCLDYKEQNSDLKLLCSGNNETPSKHLIAKLQDSVHKICERFSRDEDLEDWKDEPSDDFSQLFNEVDFISSIVNKLANDNDWLVDRLSELGQENLRLRGQASPKRVKEDNYADLKITSNAMKEFENSRSKIFYKFSE